VNVMDWRYLGSIIFTLAFGIAAIVLGLKVAKKKQPVWAYKATKIIGLGSNAPPELKLTFNEQPVSDVYRTRFILFNKGNEAILKDNVTESITIQFKGAEILRQPEIKAKSKEAIKFSAKHVVKDGYNSIEVSFLYLDHDDGAVIDVLHTTSEEITCIGNIIGVRQIKNIGEFEPVPLRRQRWRIILYSIASMSLIAIVLHDYLVSPSDSRVPLYALILAIILAIIWLAMPILTPSPYFHYMRFPRWSAVKD